MPTDLVQKQQFFAWCVARLILELNRRGYEVTLGEAWRPPEVAEIYRAQGRGISNSLHWERLAIDLVLWKGGVMLDDSADYAVAGDVWKGFSNALYRCRWGGDFKPPAPVDGNHFSIEHAGRK